MLYSFRGGLPDCDVAVVLETCRQLLGHRCCRWLWSWLWSLVGWLCLQRLLGPFGLLFTITATCLQRFRHHSPWVGALFTLLAGEARRAGELNHIWNLLEQFIVHFHLISSLRSLRLQVKTDLKNVVVHLHNLIVLRIQLCLEKVGDFWVKRGLPEDLVRFILDLN